MGGLWWVLCLYFLEILPCYEEFIPYTRPKFCWRVLFTAACSIEPWPTPTTSRSWNHINVVKRTIDCFQTYNYWRSLHFAYKTNESICGNLCETGPLHKNPVGVFEAGIRGGSPNHSPRKIFPAACPGTQKVCLKAKPSSDIYIYIYMAYDFLYTVRYIYIYIHIYVYVAYNFLYAWFIQKFEREISVLFPRLFLDFLTVLRLSYFLPLFTKP